MIDISNFERGSICPPGNTVSDLIARKGLSAHSLAQIMGVSFSVINGILSGRKEVNHVLASKLSDALGGSERFWLNRERKYREFLQLVRADISEDDEAWLSEIPIGSMKKYGWIPASRARSKILIDCLNFFDVKNVSAWRTNYESDSPLVKFRTSKAFNPQAGSVATWIKQGETEANFEQSDIWNKNGLINAIPELRELTREPDPTVFLPKLRRICLSVGVAVIVAPTPAGCQASGATKFLSSDQALLMLSFRFLSDDHFWFTFFHEIGHLVLHGKDSIFIEGGGFCEEIGRAHV